MRIDRKHVIVTGASSGIGRALALSLAERGAVLTVASRNRERLQELSREVTERFPAVPAPIAVQCDVSNSQDVARLVGGAIEQVGDIDILVNNAGVSVYGDAGLTSLEDYRTVMSVNFLGAVCCMRETLPFMKRRGSGLIVNVASVAALHGVPYLSAYCASKAALVAASESLRAELDGTGVRVMIVYPGYTETGIFGNEKNVGGARRPPGPYAPAQEVASAIVQAIEADAGRLILTLRGKALAILQGAAPWVVERAMRRVARELRDKGTPAGSPGGSSTSGRKGTEP
jgi:short-subunit dehydrogenase